MPPPASKRDVAEVWDIDWSEEAKQKERRIITGLTERTDIPMGSPFNELLWIADYRSRDRQELATVDQNCPIAIAIATV